MRRLLGFCSFLTLVGVVAGGSACAQSCSAAPADATPAVEARGQPAFTIDQVLDNMESVRKKLKTFTADVVKLRTIEVLDETERFEGTIRFKMPRLLHLRLKNVENGREAIYIVGKKYGWIYRPQKKQVERARLPKIDEKVGSPNPLEYGLARDIHALRDSYLLQLRPVEKIGAVETVPIELIPREADEYAVSKLVFWIDATTWLPVRLREFKSNNEIVETHTFSNVRLNVKIKNKVFKFKVPRGVDEILHDAE